MTRDITGVEAATQSRLFVAMPVAAADAVRIEAALAVHRKAFPEARWLAPVLLHVTLRFLGPVDKDLVAALGDAVSRCAREGDPVRITVGRGAGTRGRSGTAWLELLEGRDQVSVLADRLDALIPPMIMAPLRPTRPAPHLTVARRAPAGLVTALRDEALGRIRVTWIADRIVLFQSHTGTPAGSRYEPISEARIGDRAAA